MLKKLRYILTKSEKKHLMTLAFGSIILSVSEIFSIGIVIPIMSLFLSPEKAAASKIFQFLKKILMIQNDRYFFVFLIVSAVLLYIFKSLYAIFIFYKQQSIIGQVYSRLTGGVLEVYLRKPYSFHLMNNSSLLYKNVNTEIGNFVNGFLLSVVTISSEAIVFTGISLFLLAAYPLTTLLFIAIFGIIILLINFFLKRSIKLYSDARAKCSENVYKSGLEALNAIKEIQIYNTYAFFINRYYQAAKKSTTCAKKFNILSSLPRPILETILFSSMLLFVLINLLLNKNPLELIPLMVLFAVASLRLMPAFNKIYININTMHYFTNSLDITYDILNKEALERKGCLITLGCADNKVTPKASDSIRLENLTFCYENSSTPIFKDFTLSIPLQKSIAIFGATGSGKSTLVDIIMGLLVPSKGQLYYKGFVIHKENITEYRKTIGYVSQNIFLIDDSIEANIAFGIPEDEIDRKQIKRVIKITQLEAFVNELPEGLKTEIGERGIRISGGQKQRIGIARALYHNPEVVILDEATSALDRDTESNVLGSVKQSMDNLTLIIVSHRMNTIGHCDVIYVIEKGKIVEQGSFKELLESSLVFKKIAAQKASVSLTE